MDINTYDLFTPPAIYCQKTESDRYRERDVRYLPITVKSENNRYILIGLVQSKKGMIQDKIYAPTVVTASDCVTKCKEILGLKINEIAKLVGISRATLDLHRKGAPVKNMDYYEHLYEFVNTIEQTYGNGISKGIRNILVERKTLAQHLITNRENLFTCQDVVGEVATKLDNNNIIKTEYDESKANLRLSGIGRMA